MGMRKHEILSGDKPAIKVLASTKVGLAIAAMQGMFAVAVPRPSDEETLLIRQRFDISAMDFPSLLAALLEQAVAGAEAENAIFEDIKFSLITDSKAMGEFIGKSVHGFAKPVKGVERAGLKIEKNEAGEWETEIGFTV